VYLSKGAEVRDFRLGPNNSWGKLVKSEANKVVKDWKNMEGAQRDWKRRREKLPTFPPKRQRSRQSYYTYIKDGRHWYYG